MKISHEETIDELKEQFEVELKKIRDDHEVELEDEKNATK